MKASVGLCAYTMCRWRAGMKGGDEGREVGWGERHERKQGSFFLVLGFALCIHLPLLFSRIQHMYEPDIRPVSEPTSTLSISFTVVPSVSSTSTF